MNTKKLIGWGLWALALVYPIHEGLLSTEYAASEPGGNIKGLAFFLLTLVLFVSGYWFYDSGSERRGDAHGH